MIFIKSLSIKREIIDKTKIDSHFVTKYENFTFLNAQAHFTV
mgnify:FL=1